jgi:hypothetical protein
MQLMIPIVKERSKMPDITFYLEKYLSVEETLMVDNKEKVKHHFYLITSEYIALYRIIKINKATLHGFYCQWITQHLWQHL